MYKVFCILLLLLISSGVYAKKMSPEEIVEFADRIVYPEESIYKVEMLIKKSKIRDKTVELLVYKKKGKMLVRYINPPTERGKSLLMLKDKIWLFIPQVSRSLPLSFKLEFEGSDFSNADMTRVDLINDYQINSVKEASINNVDVYEIELKAKSLTIAYPKVIYWIRKDNLHPLRRQYYALSGKLLKTMSFSETKLLGKYERPTKIIMKNELNPDNQSVVVLKDIKEDIEIRDNIFTLRYLEGGY